MSNRVKVKAKTPIKSFFQVVKTLKDPTSESENAVLTFMKDGMQFRSGGSSTLEVKCTLTRDFFIEYFYSSRNRQNEIQIEIPFDKFLECLEIFIPNQKEVDDSAHMVLMYPGEDGRLTLKLQDSVNASCQCHIGVTLDDEFDFEDEDVFTREGRVVSKISVSRVRVLSEMFGEAVWLKGVTYVEVDQEEEIFSVLGSDSSESLRFEAHLDKESDVISEFEINNYQKYEYDNTHIERIVKAMRDCEDSSNCEILINEKGMCQIQLKILSEQEVTVFYTMNSVIDPDSDDETGEEDGNEDIEEDVEEEGARRRLQRRDDPEEEEDRDRDRDRDGDGDGDGDVDNLMDFQ